MMRDSSSMRFSVWQNLVALGFTTMILLSMAISSLADEQIQLTYPPTATLEQVQLLVTTCSLDHPRLFTQGDELKNLSSVVENDPLKQLIAKEVLRKADATLAQPPVERKMIGVRLLTTSRLCLERVLTLSLAYYLTDDDRYADRCKAELLAAARFSDWNPTHFLDTAEMTLALAIGYDWLFDKLDASQRNEIRNAIVTKGLQLQFHPRHRGWVRKPNNWGQVCHGGLVAAAVAVLQDEPELAAKTIHSAIHNVVPAMDQFAPNGSSPEGPHYWSYGTSFNIVLIDALETALGTDFGLSLAPGFSETGGFVSLLCGPTDEYFNYSDGGADREPQISLPWLANRFNRPDWLAGEYQRWQKATGPEGKVRFEALRHFPLYLLWASTDGALSDTGSPSRFELPLHWSSGGKMPIAVHRSAWNDSRALFIGLKGGTPSFSHGHMDSGSFVLESDGIRWAIDLGREDYHTVDSHGLAAWKFDQNSDRWKIFKYNNHGHNTLVIDGQLQRAAGNAPIIGFSGSQEWPYSIVDLTEIYQEQLTSARRGIAMLSTGQFIIRDELAGLKPESQIRWGMVTRAEASRLGSSVIRLSQEGESLELRALEPSHAEWQLIDISQPAQPWDSPNPGCRMLTLTATVPKSGQLVINVVAVPGSHKEESSLAVLEKPLDGWVNTSK